MSITETTDALTQAMIDRTTAKPQEEPSSDLLLQVVLEEEKYFQILSAPRSNKRNTWFHTQVYRAFFQARMEDLPVAREVIVRLLPYLDQVYRVWLIAHNGESRSFWCEALKEAKKV